MKRVAAIAVGAGVAALCAPGAASAAITKPTCGQTITQNVKLQGDLVCPVEGLVLGKSGLTVDLNGHELRAAEGTFPSAAISNPGGYGRLTLRNGSISRFVTVVSLGAEGQGRFSDLTVSTGGRTSFSSTGGYNTVKNVDVQFGTTAFKFDQGHNRITDTQAENVYNTVTVGGGYNVVARVTSTNNGFTAISAGGGHNRVVDNTVKGDPDLSIGGGDNVVARNHLPNGRGVFVSGSNNRIVDNVGSGAWQDAYRVSNGSDNVVARNQIGGQRSKLVAAPNTIFRDNVTPGGSLSVDAASTNARIVGNTFNNFPDGDGLRVEAAGSLIRNNVANGNAALGINAFPGTIDGGGNRASGNGDPRQCVGVVCQP